MATRRKSPKKEKQQAKKTVKTGAESGSVQPSPPGDKKSRPTNSEFMVVGLGSSAGGLEAIQNFFAAMPGSCPDMAFVVVSHLDPKHSSILPELIQRHTAMEVLPIQDGMKIEADRVFVIPPDKTLEMADNGFALKEITGEAGPRAHINRFFRSLAEQRGETSVAIILSGMGSDGAMGAQAIKAELGMVIAQEPQEARYDAMPRSVISKGAADLVLPVAEMPAALHDYAARLLKKTSPAEDGLPAEPLKKILAILRSRTGNDFSHYKKSTLHRRITRRMNLHGIDSIPEYVGYLRKNPKESEALVKELLIGVTSFFRDSEAFEVLKTKFFPDLFAGRQEGSVLRGWVAGCSTGEEAYSLVIALQEYIEEQQLDITIQMFATDLDEDAVEKARTAYYAGDIAKDVSAERLRRYFKKDNEGYRVISRIREAIVFARQSVIKDPPFTRLDFISCRNLLIYLDTPIQRKLLPLFHHSLNEKGLLLLGTSETIGEFGTIFSTLDPKWKIFRKKPGSLSTFQPADFPLIAPEYRVRKTADKKEVDISRLAEQILLDHYTPATVVMDVRGDIRFIHGPINCYFQIPQGSVRNYNAMEMAREGLKIFLISTMRQMSADSEQVSKRIRLDAPENPVEVQVTVRSMAWADAEGLYMLLIEEIPDNEHRKSRTGEQHETGEGGEHGRVRELEDELVATRERLRTMMEEVETSNEELRSANEEYQSTNEELQSANEELNSSKEELQSLNEELETVNSELQAKVQQVEKAYVEMKAMLDGLGVPVIFLDHNLRIRRFSSSAEQIVELLDSDVGRPLSQLATKLADVDLEEEGRRVLQSAKPLEKTIRTKSSHAFRMRILPYRSVDNPETGVVLFFVDIQQFTEVSERLTQSEKNLLSAEEAQRYAEGIIETVKQPLLVLDRKLQVISANESFYKKFHLSEKSVEGKNFFDIGQGEWNDAELRRLLIEVLPNRQSFDDFVLEQKFPRLGRRKLVLNGRRIQEHGAALDRILLAMDDVTPSKE